jgi:hemolysin activation/secretion protein
MNGINSLTLLLLLLHHVTTSALHFNWRLKKCSSWPDDQRKFGEYSSHSFIESERESKDLYSQISRGGSTNKKGKGFFTKSKATLDSTLKFWSDAFNHFSSSLTAPFRNFKKLSFLESEDTRRQNEIIQQLRTTPIERVVIVPNSTVVPNDVLQIASKRAGLLGRPLETQSVQDLAKALKQWYERQGYVLHAMTGATLQVDTRTAELSVQEPLSSDPPLTIIYCKEMVIDPEDGSIITFRQYRDKVIAKNKPSFDRVKIDRQSLNTTFVPTPTGRTNPKRLAAALGIAPGKHFCWRPSRWSTILQSGLFQKTIRTSPEPLPDGTVQLQLVVQEAPARHLEYGLSKSLYTDSWEGEIDFSHRNVFGGGETLGFTIRRGTQDAEPSVRLKYCDNNFGLGPSGYDVEIFSDYIGEQSSMEGDKSNSGTIDNMSEEQFDNDELLDRKGLSVSLRNPFSAFAFVNSGSATLERTSTKAGRHESVGSTTLNVGPFVRYLPMEARSSILAKLLTGTRSIESDASSWPQWMPFVSLTATTRQMFPLSVTPSGPLTLALQHSATASSTHIPRHEANANGIACKVRGYQKKEKFTERVSNCLVGTTEVRLPVNLPRFGDASLALFGDWCFSSAGQNQPWKRRSSVGLSLRKTLQGFPVKYDISLTESGKIGAFFGLGPDFQV